MPPEIKSTAKPTDTEIMHRLDSSAQEAAQNPKVEATTSTQAAQPQIPQAQLQKAMKTQEMVAQQREINVMRTLRHPMETMQTAISSFPQNSETIEIRASMQNICHSLNVLEELLEKPVLASYRLFMHALEKADGANPTAEEQIQAQRPYLAPLRRGILRKTNLERIKRGRIEQEMKAVVGTPEEIQKQVQEIKLEAEAFVRDMLITNIFIPTTSTERGKQEKEASLYEQIQALALLMRTQSFHKLLLAQLPADKTSPESIANRAKIESIWNQLVQMGGFEMLAPTELVMKQRMLKGFSSYLERLLSQLLSRYPSSSLPKDFLAAFDELSSNIGAAGDNLAVATNFSLQQGGIAEGLPVVILLYKELRTAGLLDQKIWESILSHRDEQDKEWTKILPNVKKSLPDDIEGFLNRVTKQAKDDVAIEQDMRTTQATRGFDFYQTEAQALQDNLKYAEQLDHCIQNQQFLINSLLKDLNEQIEFEHVQQSQKQPLTIATSEQKEEISPTDAMAELEKLAEQIERDDQVLARVMSEQKKAKSRINAIAEVEKNWKIQEIQQKLIEDLRSHLARYLALEQKPNAEEISKEKTKIAELKGQVAKNADLIFNRAKQSMQLNDWQKQLAKNPQDEQLKQKISEGKKSLEGYEQQLEQLLQGKEEKQEKSLEDKHTKYTELQKSLSQQKKALDKAIEEQKTHVKDDYAASLGQYDTVEFYHHYCLDDSLTPEKIKESMIQTVSAHPLVKQWDLLKNQPSVLELFAPGTPSVSKIKSIDEKIAGLAKIIVPEEAFLGVITYQKQMDLSDVGAFIKSIFQPIDTPPVDTLREFEYAYRKILEQAILLHHNRRFLHGIEGVVKGTLTSAAEVRLQVLRSLCDIESNESGEITKINIHPKLSVYDIRNILLGITHEDQKGMIARLTDTKGATSDLANLLTYLINHIDTYYINLLTNKCEVLEKALQDSSKLFDAIIEEVEAGKQEHKKLLAELENNKKCLLDARDIINTLRQQVIELNDIFVQTQGLAGNTYQNCITKIVGLMTQIEEAIATANNDPTKLASAILANYTQESKALIEESHNLHKLRLQACMKEAEELRTRVQSNENLAKEREQQLKQLEDKIHEIEQSIQQVEKEETRGTKSFETASKNLYDRGEQIDSLKKRLQMAQTELNVLNPADRKVRIAQLEEQLKSLNKELDEEKYKAIETELDKLRLEERVYVENLERISKLEEEQRNLQPLVEKMQTFMQESGKVAQLATEVQQQSGAAQLPAFTVPQIIQEMRKTMEGTQVRNKTILASAKEISSDLATAQQSLSGLAEKHESKIKAINATLDLLQDKLLELQASDSRISDSVEHMGQTFAKIQNFAVAGNYIAMEALKVELKYTPEEEKEVRGLARAIGYLSDEKDKLQNDPKKLANTERKIRQLQVVAHRVFTTLDAQQRANILRTEVRPILQETRSSGLLGIMGKIWYGGLGFKTESTKRYEAGKVMATPLEKEDFALLDPLTMLENERKKAGSLGEAKKEYSSLCHEKEERLGHLQQGVQDLNNYLKSVSQQAAVASTAMDLVAKIGKSEDIEEKLSNLCLDGFGFGKDAVDLMSGVEEKWGKVKETITKLVAPKDNGSSLLERINNISTTVITLKEEINQVTTYENFLEKQHDFQQRLQNIDESIANTKQGYLDFIHKRQDELDKKHEQLVEAKHKLMLYTPANASPRALEIMKALLGTMIDEIDKEKKNLKDKALLPVAEGSEKVAIEVRQKLAEKARN